jgi:hypothetical protein
MRCNGTTKASEPCPGSALRGRQYCIVHDPDPEIRARFLAASRQGGLNRRHVPALEAVKKIKAELRRAQTPLAIQASLSGVVDAVLDGTLTPQQGNTVKALALARLESFKVASAIQSKQAEGSPVHMNRADTEERYVITLGGIGSETVEG